MMSEDTKAFIQMNSILMLGFMAFVILALGFEGCVWKVRDCIGANEPHFPRESDPLDSGELP